MSKASIWIGILIVAAAAVAGAWKLGYVTPDQMVYITKMVAGWTGWTALVAVAYAGIERLFPGVLCPPRTDDPDSAGSAQQP
jgi:hypothetical protein